MGKSRRNFLKSGVWASLLPYLGFKNSIHKSFLDTQFDPFFNQELFLLNKERIFFNTASLGASPISVINAYREWTEKLESISETGHQHVKECRAAAAQFFNCGIEELAITRNTTEGINIVAQGLDLKQGDEVLLTTHEHVGGAVPWMNMVDTKGIKINLVNLDLSGKENLRLIKQAITPKTKVISISHVTCTTGMILPVKELVLWCRKNNVFTCIDGAQAIGMIDVNLKDLDPDFYATSGHKWLYGPKGTGFLFINKKSIKHLQPTFAGAYTTDAYKLNSLEYTYRNIAEREEYGTRNTPMIMSLKAAIDFFNEHGKETIIRHGQSLASQLQSLLEEINSIEILSPMDKTYSTAMVSFRSSKKDYKLLQKELMSNHRCRVRGIYENDLNAIRISCAFYNSQDQIKYLASSIKEILS